MSEITVVDGVVRIPYMNIVNYVYNIAECIDGFRTFDDLEQQHQQEVNCRYGRDIEKEYEEVPHSEIERYNQWVAELKAELENDDYE